uniref:Dioxygenase n=1 Tax=viral metagenome TaxID=1070528 RepID=A0A6C0DDE9_9ZZZZ
MTIYFFLFILLIKTIFINTLFVKIPFGPRFKIKDREFTKKLEYKLIESEQNILKKLDGFYGMIGPDIDIKTVSTIFDLFTGDGLIHGVFFDNGELTFIKYFIRTDKLRYEQKNGKIPKNNILKILFEVLSSMKLLPKLLGVSNTALMHFDNNTYSLYERDLPYKLDINFKTKNIKTIEKKLIKHIQQFSAHSKTNGSTIETIDCDIFRNEVRYFELDKNFETIKTHTIKTKYIPIIHDFWSSQNKIIFIDSPLIIDFNNFLNTPMSVKLDETKETIINVLDKTTMKIERYHLNESFYVFHFANSKENDTHIDIYASLYEKIDFNELNITGKYRKITINKRTKLVTIEKNPELEELNIEFPISYGNRTIFKSIENRVNNGFVICEGMELIKRIELVDKFICGEPAIKKVDDTYYLIAFYYSIYNNKDTRLFIMNLDAYTFIDIHIKEEIGLGFHSIFIPTKC